MAIDFKLDYWSSPVYKILANNDTGAAPGHQGGAAIPKDLRRYFPQLKEEVTPESPTVDTRILAEIWLEAEFLESVDTRYQFQTWTGKRKVESRLTSNLGSILNKAKGGDLLLIQRDREEPKRYRLILVRQGTNAFRKLTRKVDVTKKRWGMLPAQELPPLDEQETRKVENEIKSAATKPFAGKDPNTPKLTSTTTKNARSEAFRNAVLEAYDYSCAFCGLSVGEQVLRSVIEGAHVIPKTEDGVDDVRNGLGLCRNHHWAFDRLFLTVLKDRTIFVPEEYRHDPKNQWFATLHGNPIREAIKPEWKVHEDALKYHRDKIIV